MILRGSSRALYNFVGVAWPSAKMPVQAGLYAFGRRERNRSVTPLYFGESDDLMDLLRDEEVFAEAKRLGMDTLLIRENMAGESNRRREKMDLVRFYKPPLNTVD